jgi:hypothetical protein
VTGVTTIVKAGIAVWAVYRIANFSYWLGFNDGKFQAKGEG